MSLALFLLALRFPLPADPTPRVPRFVAISVRTLPRSTRWKTA